MNRQHAGRSGPSRKHSGRTCADGLLAQSSGGLCQRSPVQWQSVGAPCSHVQGVGRAAQKAGLFAAWERLWKTALSDLQLHGALVRHRDAAGSARRQQRTFRPPEVNVPVNPARQL